VSEASFALDDAFDRMAASGFELPNGFVNHGPMACEALAALGCEDDIDPWARRFAGLSGRGVEPVSAAGFEWQAALGDYRRLPEWIGYLQGAIDDDGWTPVVASWVPRLLPSLAVALFHGAIRAAHAVRAIDSADTPARRAELARALGYWAARFRRGEPVGAPGEPDGVARAITMAAGDGARHYLARPTIYNLHGVTGAMAVELFAAHIPSSAGAAGLAQIRAEHDAMHRGAAPVTDIHVVGVADDELAKTATASRDPHQVKLVEACRRGFQATGDPAFAAAAETVVGLS